MKDAYCHAKVQVLVVQHGLQCRVAYPQFTRNAEVSVSVQCLFYFGLVHGNWARFCIVKYVFQHLFILLDQPTAAMIAQNAQENIFIVGKMGHSLDQIDMRMFRALTRSVFRPTPHDNLPHLVQDAVSLFKVPPQCTTHPVWQMFIESVEESLA